MRDKMHISNTLLLMLILLNYVVQRLIIAFIGDEE